MFSEMGRQVLIMASQQSTTNKPTKPESAKPTTTKGGRAKKSGKGTNSKKQPQRGIGVAQLERLRLQGHWSLQDRWKKMTEIPQPEPEPQTQTQHATPLPQPQYHQNFQYQNLPDPLSSVPVQYSASGYNVPVLINGPCGNGLLVGHRVGNGTTSVLGYNVGGNNLVVDPSPYGFGTPEPRLGVGAVYETSRELTSMPKIQSLSPNNRCDVCCKKNKRINSGKYMGFDGRSEKSPVLLPMNSSGYVEFNKETAGFGGTTEGRKYGYPGGCSIIDESVEVRAVHRKGSSRGGGILMEYDFFPEGGKNEMVNMRGGAHPKEEEDEMLQTERAEASVSSHEEPSDITYNYYNGYGIRAADSYDHHHDPLDLSLKLSF